MAPEQYAPDKHRAFAPDAFALGVIMCELLTGRHPCGKTLERTKNWNEHEWKEWADHGHRDLAGIESDDAAGLISGLLDPKPETRTSLEDGLSRVRALLALLDEASWKQLDLLFRYYDVLARYSQNDDELHAASQLARLPNAYKHVINELEEQLVEPEAGCSDPETVVAFCKRAHTLGQLYLQGDETAGRPRATQLGYKILRAVFSNRTYIRSSHLYPPLRFDGIALVPEPLGRDFEAIAELVSYGWSLLESSAINDVPFIMAICHYVEALKLRMEGNDVGAIRAIELAIQYQPSEASLHLFHAISLDHRQLYLNLLDARQFALTVANLRGQALESAKRAVELDSGWEEAQNLLSRLSRLPPGQDRTPS